MPTPSATNYTELYALQHRWAQEGISSGAGLAAGSGQSVITHVYSGGANYGASAGSIQTNAATGPDGTAAVADTFTDNGGASAHNMFLSAAVTIPNNSWIRMVAYLKASPTFTTVAFGQSTAGVAWVVFDILNGVVVSTSSPPSPGALQQDPMIIGGISPLTPSTVTCSPANASNPQNNWFRCTVQLFANNVSLGQASGATVAVIPALFANGGRSYTGGTNVAFTVARPPPSLPGNYTELIALENLTCLYSRNTG